MRFVQLIAFVIAIILLLLATFAPSGRAQFLAGGLAVAVFAIALPVFATQS